MTKYRINNGPSRLTLCNSRVSKQTLELACSMANVVRGLPLTDNKGNYTSKDAKIWQRVSLQAKRRVITDFIAAFDNSARLTSCEIKWG